MVEIAVKPQTLDLSLISVPGPDSWGRDKGIDVLKGLAIIGVLFAHMGFISRLSKETINGIEHIQQVFAWCVTAFFFCSGMLTRTDTCEHLEWCSFLIKRAKRLLLPCLAFSLSYKILLCLLWETLALGDSSFVPERTVIGYLEFFLRPAGPQFYFLPYLFFVSVVSIVVLKFIKNLSLGAWVILLGCALFYAARTAPRTAYGADVELIPGYFLSFWTGLMARERKLQNRAWWGGAIICIAVACIVGRTSVYVHFLAPTIIYIAVSHLEFSKALSFLGTKSGGIYVWHNPVLLPACSILAARLFPNEVVQVVATITLCVILAILMGEATQRVRFLAWFRF